MRCKRRYPQPFSSRTFARILNSRSQHVISFLSRGANRGARGPGRETQCRTTTIQRVHGDGGRRCVLLQVPQLPHQFMVEVVHPPAPQVPRYAREGGARQLVLTRTVEQRAASESAGQACLTRTTGYTSRGQRKRDTAHSTDGT